jgi:molybdate transport system substrate-binding protein
VNRLPGNQSHSSPFPVKEIKVLCAGAAREVITNLCKRFQDQTGINILFSFGPVGMLKEKITAGETGDVVILTVEALELIAQQRKINPLTIVEIGRTGVGLAVRDGSPVPDVSTPKALRRTLLNAKSVAYADPALGATSGIHFAGVAKTLGIAETLENKCLRLAGQQVMSAVAEGKAAIGVMQITEIVPVPGVILAGPLPADLQKITTYAAGLLSSATLPEAAETFIRYITDPNAASAYTSAGFELY